MRLRCGARPRLVRHATVSPQEGLALARAVRLGLSILACLAGALAVVDTTTYAASVPVVDGPSDLRPWLIVAAAVLAGLSLLVALAATRRRFRGRPAPA